MSNNRNGNRNRNRGQGRGQQPPGAVPGGTVIPFRFKHGDTEYTLPPAAAAFDRMTGGQLIDAARDDIGQLRYFVGLLDVSDIAPEAMAALRDMDQRRFMNVMTLWTKKTGAHPGKSAQSST
jgi:hypothetical protein